MDAQIEEAANKLIGAAIEVHRHLGPGYLESVYEEALSVELALRGIPACRQVAFGLEYKGHVIGEGRLDFLVNDNLIVELKYYFLKHNQRILVKSIFLIAIAQMYK